MIEGAPPDLWKTKGYTHSTRTPLVYFSDSLLTEAGVEVLHLSCAQVVTV